MMRPDTGGLGATRRPAKAPAAALWLALVVGSGRAFGCSDDAILAGGGDAGEPLSIVLRAPDDVAGAVELVGLSAVERSILRLAGLTPAEWQALLSVSVGATAEDARVLPPVLGVYTVTDDAIRFSPRYGFDPGREYRVTFDAARAPPRVTGLDRAGKGSTIDAVVAAPGEDARSSTKVVQVFPTADVLPENLLRMYVHFSGPMRRTDGADYVLLLDANGQAVDDVFLPLKLALWNQDRTRYTLLLDPGRVKQGIRPNREMGRAIAAGNTYTLAIDQGWLDASGAPLAESYTRTFRVVSPRDQAIDPASWRLVAPEAGTRDPLVVTFPEPLDHALLRRALLVTTDRDLVVGGDVDVEAAETRWVFTPYDAWRSRGHRLTALPTLEDPAGNRVGRAFEVPSTAGAGRRAGVEAVEFVPRSSRP
jgi:hypothetical protein